MRKIVCLSCALFLALPAVAQQSAAPAQAAPSATSAPAAALTPDHAVSADQVQQLMDLTGTAALQKQMMHNMMPTLQKAMPPYMPQDVLDDLERSVLGKDMQDAIVRVYQEHLSSDDAAAAIAFYKTPEGQRMLAAMPVILQELQSAGAQIGMKVMQDVMLRHKLEIQAAKDKYDQEHPWSAPKN